MTHILLVMTFVGMYGSGGVRDWRFMGEYATQAQCEQVAAAITEDAITRNPRKYLCVPKGSQ